MVVLLLGVVLEPPVLLGVVLLVTTLLVTALDAGTELVPALLVPVLLVAEEPVEDVATPLELTAPEDATVLLERGTALDNGTPLDVTKLLLLVVVPELVPGSTSVVFGPQATSKAAVRGIKARRCLFISGS